MDQIHSQSSTQQGRQFNPDLHNTSTPLNTPPKRRIVTPLFDPHGLGANAADSTDEEKEGLKETPKDGTVGATTGKARETNTDRRGRRRRSSENVASKKNDAEIAARDYTNAQATTEQKSENNSGNRDESTSSRSARLWWQREDADGDQHDGIVQASGVVKTPSASMSRQRPKIDIEARQARNRQASDGTNGSSQSPLVRSPAAAFLSSMNDMLASTPSSSSSAVWNPSSRNYSLSPARTDASRSFSAAILADTTGSAMVNAMSKSGNQESAGQFGLASAAAQLYNRVQGSPSLQGLSSSSGQHISPNNKPDDEGSRIGPGGRYLLGKTIGFGGFSTVREAWDMGENVTSSTVGDDEAKGWHRVAVKIIYGPDESKSKDSEEQSEHSRDQKSFDELELWKSIPAHPNLLPLLYHECMHLAEENMAGSANKTIDFLVMPFCEGNLLTYVRMNGESLTELRTQTLSRNGSISGVELTRSSSTRSSRDDGRQNMIQVSGPYGRTGSGFIPHAHRSNTVNDRVISAPLSALLARSSSLATSPASENSNNSATAIQTGSLFRSTSVRMRQSSSQPSKGLPISVSKDVVLQITEALLCLHHKAGILHGDLKLENVLGQQWIAPRSHLHSESLESSASNEMFDRQRENTSSSDSSTPLKSSETEAATGIASICWRVADFGLAHKIPSKEEERREPQGHWVPSLGHSRPYDRRAALQNPGAIAQSAANLRRHSSYAGGSNSSQSRSQAGSLAYAAPEVFLVPDTDDDCGSSPFAPDMWALGCIIYALFAGRLPFSDTFEPRLQNKIIQGKWEMPDRLKRRGQRSKRVRPDDESLYNGSESSMNRANSFGESMHARRQTFQLTALNGESENTQSVPSDQAVDLSASMPTLPGMRGSTTSIAKSDSNQSIVFADQSDLTMSQEIDEEDPTSDDEVTVDKFLDGKSKDRVAIRRILRGLLEPDSSKRWTVLQLSSDEWISSKSLKSDATQLNAELQSNSLVDGSVQSSSQREGAFDSDSNLPSSLVKEFSRQQPSDLQNLAIPEDDAMIDSQESEEHEDHHEPSTDEDQQDVRRGRAPRRNDTSKDSTRKSRPIDIDRSQSRSRSRVRDDSPVWGLDIPPGGGGFNWRQQQQTVQHQHHAYDHRSHYGDSPSDSRFPARQSWSARSSSVDHQNMRGRKIDNGLRGSDREKSTSTSRSTEKRSGSRSGSGRGGSRSTSRGRRAELDLIMPQLSLHRSNLSSGQIYDHDVEVAAEEESGNDSSSRAALQSDDHNVERSSIWKSPLRARDRLVANLLGGGGSGQNSSGTNTPNKRHMPQTPEEDLPSNGQKRNEHIESSSNHSKSPLEERPWWQRGRNTKY